MPYFLAEEATEFVKAIVQSGIDYSSARPAFLAHIDPFWVANIMAPFPGIGAVAQATIDLGKLNSVDRLSNGTVPIEIWMRNAALLTTGLDQNRLFQRALDHIGHSATGSPRINVAGLPERHEVIVGRDDMLPFGFLRRGALAGASVARLSVPRFEDEIPAKLSNGDPMVYLGTGWLIAEDYLMTNWHVINARSEGEAVASDCDLKLQGAKTCARFDFDEDNVQGNEKSADSIAAWDEKLDYAVLHVPGVARTSLTRAPKPISKTAPDAYISVNIIQHPEGTAKKIALRNNLVTAATDADLRYFTDTKQGSSGSPVFDDQWRVVALHRGSTVAENVSFQGNSVAWVNVGTHITRIVEDISQRFPQLSARLR